MANISDIRIDISLTSHRKYKRLKRILGLETMEFLVSLWVATAAQCPDGFLSEWDAQDIAECSGWKKDPQIILDALVSGEWLEVQEGGYYVHDWHEHQPWVVKAPERKAKALKANSARWSKDATSNTPSKAPSIPEAKQPGTKAELIKKLFHQTFARTASSNDYQLFKVIEAFTVEQIEKSFKAAKGKTSLKYVTAILENLPEEKDTSDLDSFMDGMEDK